MLAAQRPLGAVRANRYEAQQRVQVVAGQRTAMGPHAQLQLGQPGQRCKRYRDREHGEERRQRRAGRIDPGDARGGGGQLAQCAQEPARVRRPLTQLLQAVHPFGQIGDEPAVEVAIAEPRNVREETKPELDLQPSSGGQQPRRQRQLEGGDQHSEDEQRGECPQTLFANAEIAADVERAAEEQRLDHHRRGGHR